MHYVIQLMIFFAIKALCDMIYPPTEGISDV